MRAGQLRQRIIIQQTTPSRDAMGGVTDSWGTYATVWANVVPLFGKEWNSANKENAELGHKMIIRYYTGITPAMRVSWNSRVFDIEAVLNIDTRNHEMHLLCREVVL